MLNFKPWDELLRQYVDSQGRVNYQDWKAESRQKLTDWLEEISQIDLKSCCNRDLKLALWLNLYNALTIDRVLSVYPIASIRPTILGIPNWIGFLAFFSRPIYKLSDRSYSLNNIEHDILRPEFSDPRIHFALVCASIGCPLLRNEAYLPESVQTQLKNDAERFINNRAKVYYDSSSNTLYCSQIFKWYRQDFLKVADSIAQYIQKYLSTVEVPKEPRIRYLSYDWSLNQRVNTGC
ncbi:MAG: DUF547 domain-containing protein [Hydrococcus sp. Prado102]|jgi:hypothetical protein|nr:DUF547 domain-containing protein [Hydrococcus sp. Prado102]